MATYDNRPYLKRMIKDIQPDDHNIQLVGTVKEQISETEFRLSDGTGEISVIFNNLEPLLDKIHDNMTIKVIGNLEGDSQDILSVRIASDYSDLNMDLYTKAYELKKKYLDD